MENLKHIVIRNATIIDKESPYHKKKKDILIEDGFIKKIDKNISIKSAFFETKIQNLHISPGWLDLHVRLGEPGYEQRETIQSGLKEAAQGGFTGVLVMPSTNPPIQTKADINFLIKKAQNNIVELFPSGCITKNCKQEEITEMFDMHINGALAFTDDKNSIQNAMLMNIALEYAKNFDGLIMTTSVDAYLAKKGQINESAISTKMGLKPLPELSENIMIDRDLTLLKYTQSKLHLSTISSYDSVKKIKQAKKNKLNISADVAAYSLLMSDEWFQNFDSNLKVLPPLRSEKTRKELINGIINGTIDAVTSDHTPIEIENKKCEFQKAKFGMIGLHTVFPILNTVLNDKLELSKIIDLICHNPRKILKKKTPKIQEGEIANMTLFDPQKEWTYNKKQIASLSRNTPLINYKFKGDVLGVINKKKIHLNN